MDTDATLLARLRDGDEQAFTDLVGRYHSSMLRLAMAFVHRPKLLLLDEPGNSLDDEGLRVLGRALEQHQARGGAVMWCAPVGEQLLLHYDRLLSLEDGRLSPA